MRKLRSAVLLVAGMLALGAAWLVFAPSRIGGSSDYVVVHGTSMEPMLHTGDLAIVRPVSSYKVGEVVAYHSQVLHAFVLHRIVAVSGGRFTFKGDNNHFLDPDHAGRSALLGRLWFSIPHGGNVLSWIREPWHAGLIAACIVLFGAGGPAVRRKRRRAKRQHASPRKMFERTRGDVPAVLFAVAGVSAAIVGLAFAWPTSGPTTKLAHYTERMHLSYGAKVPPSPVYPSGTVRDGQPIFRRLVSKLSLSVQYVLATPAKGIGGTAELGLTLSDPSGWSQRMLLMPPHAFKGAAARMNAVLDLTALDSAISGIEHLTGISAETYSVTITPVVHVHALIDGRRVSDTDSVPFDFAVNPLTVQPTETPSATGSAQAPVTVAMRGIEVPARRPIEWTLLGRHLRVAAVRFTASLIALLSLFSAGLMLLLRRPKSKPKHMRGRSVISVSSMRFDPLRTVVEVGEMRSLVRIADRYERLIFYTDEDGVDTYFVDDDNAVYRYCVRQSTLRSPSVPALSSSVLFGPLLGMYRSKAGSHGGRDGVEAPSFDRCRGAPRGQEWFVSR